MNATNIDVDAIKWTKRPPGLGTIESNNAEMAEHLADEFLDGLGCVPRWDAFAELDGDRTAFRCDELQVVVVVAIDADADVCGDRYVDKSRCVRVEVVRA